MSGNGFFAMGGYAATSGLLRAVIAILIGTPTRRAACIAARALRRCPAEEGGPSIRAAAVFACLLVAGVGARPRSQDCVPDNLLSLDPSQSRGRTQRAAP